MSEKRTRMSWKFSRGLYLSPDSYELRRGGEVLAIVQKSGNLWFSYGMRGGFWNTSSEPDELEKVKKDAIDRVKSINADA